METDDLVVSVTYTTTRKVQLILEDYKHPKHPEKKIRINIYIDEDELEKVIKRMKDDHDKNHTHDIPTGIRGEATLK